MTEAEYVTNLTALSRGDVGRAGGKGANLGELLHADLPVPPGFVVTTDAYLVALDLAVADRAEEAAALPVDGVGLLRAEFLILDALQGKHPRQVIDTEGGHAFVEKTEKPLLRIARAFALRPVIYRTYDFRGLEGGERCEPVEENPMIGYRGCFRYVQDPSLFKLELETLARVQHASASGS